MGQVPSRARRLRRLARNSRWVPARSARGRRSGWEPPLPPHTPPVTPDLIRGKACSGEESGTPCQARGDVWGGHETSSAGKRGITPRWKQRATAGAGVPGPDGRGCATIVANDGREVARNRLFGPVAAGGNGADSRPDRHTVGAYPRFWSQAPIVPAPAASRRCGARTSEHRPSTRKQSRSANRLRTRYGRAYNRYGFLSSLLLICPA